MKHNVQQPSPDNGQPSATIEYVYDGNGNRYSKTVNGQTRYYSYDTSGNIVSEYKRVMVNGAEESQTLVRYVRDTSGKAISMLQYPEPGTQNPVPSTYYFVYNGHGDVTALTDSTGTVVASYSYDEFGNLISNTGDTYNPLRYSGANNAYYDTETSLYKMGVRYYMSDVGRWLTRDKFKGFTPAPDTSNAYVYVINNPITNIDPSGFVYARFNGSKFKVYHTNRKLWKTFRAISGPSKDEKLKNKGRIPHGAWRMLASEITYRKWYWSLHPTLNAYGPGRIPLNPINNTQTFGRTGFTLHGGPWRPTHGCIRIDDGNWNWVAELLPKLSKQRMNVYVRY